MITYNCCLLYDPQIPNFNLANLESGPLLDNFDGPVGPWGLRQIKKLHNTKC